MATTLNDQDDLILVNVIEELVKQKVNTEIKSFDMCNCEKCKLNACAIALNSLPPHYVTTSKGILFAGVGFSKIDYQANVMVEVAKALVIVKEHPMH